MKNTPLIETRNLRRDYLMKFGVVQALKGVDLDVHEGESVALVGTSGSGKSTLLSILGCLDQPTEGSYRLEGEAVDGLSPIELAKVRNTRLGFVFQSFNLLSRLSADENVSLPLRYTGWSRKRRLERARELLELVGLGDRISHTPNELSGGECQRVAIARALAHQAPLLLADEPTGNLDSKTGAGILQLFESLHEQGHTIVMVTHDEEIAARAQHRYRMADGRIVERS